MHVAEPEGVVAHFGEHPALVAGVDVTVVVIDQRADPDARLGRSGRRSRGRRW